MSDEYDSVEEEVEEVDEVDEEEEEEAPKKSRKKREKKWKDPNKPKRAMSAYFLFSQAMRETVKAENPEAAFGEIARLLSAKYKALSDKELKKWTKKAEADKLRYQEEMKDYVPMEEPGGKRKKAKKDPNAPKRNMSAYFLFSLEERPRVKESNPEADFAQVARIISQRFKELSASERKIWDKKAAEDKERYQREKASYEG
eukprot:Nitzschia sp. Nitz4//scaffold2_size372955//188557//189679//NITZ4_000428-RA/size372955-snap-gene-0.32-mRNA-1//1//CDS//3329546793//7939//frame0